MDPESEFGDSEKRFVVGSSNCKNTRNWKGFRAMPTHQKVLAEIIVEPGDSDDVLRRRTQMPRNCKNERRGKFPAVGEQNRSCRGLAMDAGDDRRR